jgi:hypothetical protein
MKKYSDLLQLLFAPDPRNTTIWKNSLPFFKQTPYFTSNRSQKKRNKNLYWKKKDEIFEGFRPKQAKGKFQKTN